MKIEEGRTGGGRPERATFGRSAEPSKGERQQATSAARSLLFSLSSSPRSLQKEAKDLQFELYLKVFG